MNDDFLTRRVPVTVEEEVLIPTLDGKGVAETVKVTVPALRDPVDGEIYLTEEALGILDDTKARYMGLLLPRQMKELRQTFGLSQRQISELLQIGEKTWTRWESGRERPSRSLNLLLLALYDGRIDLAYLRLHQEPMPTRTAAPAPQPAGSRQPVPASYSAGARQTPGEVIPISCAA